MKPRLWGLVSGASPPATLLCPQEAGRLLYIGQNEWTHVNCAIWSAEVFEENDGSLKNVHAAVARGRQMVRAWAWRGGQSSGPSSTRRQLLFSLCHSLSFHCGPRYLSWLSQHCGAAVIAALFLFVLSGCNMGLKPGRLKVSLLNPVD